LTSAKTGCQVDSVFSALASSLLSRDEANQVISPPKKKPKPESEGSEAVKID
jgi:hypothetical protein